MIAARHITHNVLWNFAGHFLPLFVGLLAFPVLLDGLGVERFGLLGIAWMLVGYFSLFDLGLSRAVTYIVAERVGSDDQNAAKRVASTALLLMWGFGGGAAFLVWGLAPWLAGSVLAMPAGLRQEAVDAFRMLSLSVPFVIHTAGLRGILEAHQAFRVASYIRSALGVGIFLGPLVILPFSASLVHCMAVLAMIRVAGWVAHRRAVEQRMALGYGLRGFDRQWIKPLFSFGSWMTVTNLIGPLMVYLDRFLIGAVVSVGAVSYYIIPYELVTRLWIFPAAIAGVLFPFFSAHCNLNVEKTALFLNRGGTYAFIILFPLLMIVSYLAPEILGLWLGEEYALGSTQILRWLSAGVLTGSIAQMSFALIQGAGRSDWTAKLHMAEAIPYWALLLWLMDRYGVVGAAGAWFVRTTADALALIWGASRLGPSFQEGIHSMMMVTLPPAGIVLFSLFLESIVTRLIVLIVALVIFGIYTWFKLISNVEREWLRTMVFNWR